MHIAVIGTGYVGLVSGACFAEFGNTVVCVDSDRNKIEKINSGEMPIYEPGLEALVARNVQARRLEFTTDIKRAIESSLVIMLAVGTPPSSDGSADLSQIEAVALEIASSLNGYKVIVTKSTVPVGASGFIKAIIEKNKGSNYRYSVASNPEFLREGAAINDFMRPDRVVIGCRDEEGIEILKDLYRPLYLIETPFVVTNPESAEMIKYASNAFLATKISFINEIANLCDLLGADVRDVAKGMGMDKRIGGKFLHPGPGFGGSCFPKDVKALAALARSNNYEMKLTDAVLDVNEKQTASIIDRVKRAVPNLAGKTVAVLGLAFKPETDDMREAPSLKIISDLLSAGAKVRVYDPAAMTAARRMLSDVTFCEDEYDAATSSNAIVVVTEWNQFRGLDFERLRKLMTELNIVDLRNIYNPADIRKAGFNYASIGRPGDMANARREENADLSGMFLSEDFLAAPTMSLNS
ncbi:MAG TPA: UDP-glucose/GDP-mannose dehydrogenase family protein [Blastocatellia bacterium]|nr:UDP-glucose/GDP-mannose dehydrogenase family protein [Blastocatellia bacterium]